MMGHQSAMLCGLIGLAMATHSILARRTRDSNPSSPITYVWSVASIDLPYDHYPPDL
jgi:hypothetical protein